MTIDIQGVEYTVGFDISAYQPNFDCQAAANEGFDFGIVKATEGSDWRSNYFHDQIKRARSANLLVAAYHFLRSDSTPEAQAENVKSMVSLDTPLIPDVESIKNSRGQIVSAPTLAQTWRFYELVRAAGYRVPLIYIPTWYWKTWGSPDLRGLPPNWHSRYPDNEVRRAHEFNLNDPAYWPMIGGLPTLVAQFTSSLAVANYPNGRIDGNAFRGTRSQLAAHLLGEHGGSGGGVAAPPTARLRRNDKMNGFSIEVLDDSSVTWPRGFGALIDMTNDRTTGLSAANLRLTAEKADVPHYGVSGSEAEDLLGVPGPDGRVGKYGAGNPSTTSITSPTQSA